jgi:hypothetical protein
MIMDKRAILDKSAGAASQADTCPQCGGPLTDFGCRYAPMGQWCVRGTLVDDPRRIMQSAPDPLRQIVDETREVKKAVESYERLSGEAERVAEEWRAAAMASFRARQ